MKRAALMSRVSSDEQAKGYSLEVQSEALEKYCIRNGIEIVYTFNEEHSAKNFDRPAFKEFMIHAKKNKEDIDLLLFTSWDRFSRNIQEAYKVIDSLRFLGITAQAIEQPIDLSIPENKAILAMFLVIPEIDNDRRSIKTRGGIRAALKSGRWCSRAPYGYRNTRDENNKPLIVRNEHSDSIRWAFEQVLKNGNQREIQRELNKRGCMIQKTRVGLMLRNPVYIGKIEVPEYGKEPYQLVEGVHEAIISEKLFYQVQDALNTKSPKRVMSKSISDQLLPLRGKLKCSKCEAKLTGSRSRGRRGGQYAYYHCNHCGNERHRADLINEVMEVVLDSAKLDSGLDKLVEAICSELLTVDSSQRAARISKLKQAVSKQNDRILRLQDNLADAFISSDEYRSMITRFSKEIDEAQIELNLLQAHDSSKESLIRKAVQALNNLGTTYRNTSAEGKVKLVGSIFPEMIEFDGNKCRTPKINEAAALCLNVDGRLRGNKKGTLHHKMEVSLLVARRGIEPLLPG